MVINLLLIGSHVSFRDKQLLGCVEAALSYGANTFMFYTGAPANSIRRTIDDKLTKKAHELMKLNNINPKNIVCHAPYVVNLANNINPSLYEFSINFIKQEIKRCESLGVSKLIIHPGSHVTLTKEKGIENIINALNIILDGSGKITILLEYMAGKGSECGCNLEELKTIIDGVKNKELIGICIDTCHLNDYGVNLANFNDFLTDFAKTIGLEKLQCIHINDSKNPIGSHKDRHENIGFGTIGFENILNIVHNEQLKNVPKILETPTFEDKPTYKFEIDMLKNKTFDPNLYEKVKDFYK